MVVFNTLITSFVNKKLVFKAEEARERMKKAGVKPDVDTFNALAKGYADLGQSRGRRPPLRAVNIRY